MKNLKIHLNVILINLFMVILIHPTYASAMEIKNYDSTRTYQGQTQYGYNIPGLYASPDGANKIGFALSGSNQNSHMYFNGYSDVVERDLPTYISEISNNLNMAGEMSKTFLFDFDDNRFAINFQPGLPGSNDAFLSEPGKYFNYDNYYSFDFNMIMYSKNAIPYENNQPTTNKHFIIPSVLSTMTKDSNGNYHSIGVPYTSQVEYINNHVVVIHYHINSIKLFYNDNWNYTFPNFYTQGVIQGDRGDDNTDPFLSLGSNSYNMPLNEYSVIISQPLNVVMWSSESSITCSDKCAKQEDIDNHNSQYFESNVTREQKEKDLVSNLFGLDFLDDFGLGNVVFNLFGNLKHLLENHSSNSCYTYTINILGKDITLPCGNVFWNRNDISSFENVWNLFWLGLVGYFVARNIYITILSMLDFNSSISVEVEKKTRLKL